jgi:hypothetical protein
MIIDRGSSINLLYRTSMEKLGIPVAQLKSRRLTFHGIMPGLLCFPMGRIQLDVLFGEKGNSHRKPIWLIRWTSAVHTTCYLDAPLWPSSWMCRITYLKMKLPGPRSMNTITGCYKKSMECARASSKLAEALVITEEKRQLLHRVALTQQDMLTHQSPVQQF